MRKYYSGITVFKLVGALVVLFGHIRLPEVYGQLAAHFIGLNQAMAFTVPCFYIVSGFLAYKGWAQAPSPGRYIRGYLGWLGGAYVVLCLWHVITNTLPALVAGYQQHTLPVQQLHWLFEVVFVSGPSLALWFIPPLLLGVGVAYFFERRGQLRTALLVAALGFGLAQLADGSLRGLVEALGGAGWAPYQLRQEWLLRTMLSGYLGIGLPSVLLGVVVARHEAAFLGLGARRLALVAGPALALELLLLNWALPGYPYRLLCSMVPISLLLFYGVLAIRLDGIRRYHALINRFSALSFFTHMYLIALNRALLGVVGPDLSPRQALACWLLTAAEVVLLTALLTVVLRRYPARRPVPAAASAPEPAALAEARR